MTATGEKVAARGERNVGFWTDGGKKIAIKFEVTNISKPLLSVSKLTKAGNRVVFEEFDGTITNRATGLQLKMVLVHDVYYLVLWVRDDDQGGVDERFEQLAVMKQQEEEKIEKTEVNANADHSGQVVWDSFKKNRVHHSFSQVSPTVDPPAQVGVPKPLEPTMTSVAFDYWRRQDFTRHRL